MLPRGNVNELPRPRPRSAAQVTPPCATTDATLESCAATISSALESATDSTPLLAADVTGWKSLFKEADHLALAGEWQEAYININESKELFETSWNLSMFESMGCSILISANDFLRDNNANLSDGQLITLADMLNLKGDILCGLGDSSRAAGLYYAAAKADPRRRHEVIISCVPWAGCTRKKIGRDRYNAF